MFSIFTLDEARLGIVFSIFTLNEARLGMVLSTLPWMRPSWGWC